MMKRNHKNHHYSKAMKLLRYKHSIMDMMSLTGDHAEELEVELYLTGRFGVFDDFDMNKLPDDLRNEVYDWYDHWVFAEDDTIPKEVERVIAENFAAINTATSEIVLYLNCREEDLPEQLMGKVNELALVIYQLNKARTIQPIGVKSSSYTEGDVSQSMTMLTAQDMQAAKDVVLHSIAHYRRRATWKE